mmetsp:Transcript_42064/g.85878  ORF Transcript_42064/g.85878 Transcript_42064/m.85878 type:complete len:203 (+) Transcript_42064:1035-1643(+)
MDARGRAAGLDRHVRAGSPRERLLGREFASVLLRHCGGGRLAARARGDPAPGARGLPRGHAGGVAHGAAPEHLPRRNRPHGQRHRHRPRRPASGGGRAVGAADGAGECGEDGDAGAVVGAGPQGGGQLRAHVLHGGRRGGELAGDVRRVSGAQVHVQGAGGGGARGHRGALRDELAAAVGAEQEADLAAGGARARGHDPRGV